MSQPLEFFFDYTCPYAYLASTQIEGVAERTGRELRWRPMLLGGVFRALEVPQVLFKTLSPSKAHHNFADMHRWAQFWDVALDMPSGHPFRSVEALRATLAAPEEKRPALIHSMYNAYWIEKRDIADPAVIRDVLDRVGLEDVPSGPYPESIKTALREETEEAIQRGVFGAPATFLGEEMYWGQDRLPMLEARLGGSFPLPEVPLEGEAAEEVDFFFDVSSPFAYLASTQVERWERDWNVRIRWRPIFLGGLFTSLEALPFPSRPSASRRETGLQPTFNGGQTIGMFRSIGLEPFRASPCVRCASFWPWEINVGPWRFEFSEPTGKKTWISSRPPFSQN